MNWQQKTVLVTGGGGFLGRYIIERLIELNCSNIKSIGRKPQPELKTMGINTIQGDIADSDSLTDACKNCNIVFHTAAKADIWGRYKDFYSVNVIGTQNIIEACKHNQVDCLINTSTPSVVCTDEDINMGNEKIPYPDTFPSYYPETKARAEKMVSDASQSLLTISLRPHLIWGVRDSHILPGIVERAKAKRLIQVGDGTNLVDMTHVKNATEAHILAAEAVTKNPDISGNNYFISDDKPVNLWDWINELLSNLQMPQISKSISFRKAYTIGRVMEFVYKTLTLKSIPPMTRFVAIQLAHAHYFDISAAKKDLQYKPIINYKQAYDETLAWIKKENQ